MYIYIHIYIYIYIYREREIYIYTYIYIYREREMYEVVFRGGLRPRHPGRAQAGGAGTGSSYNSIVTVRHI